MNQNQHQPSFGSWQPTQGYDQNDSSSSATNQQNFLPSEFSHNSSSSSLKTDGSQFPDYQLVNGQNFGNQSTIELNPAEDIFVFSELNEFYPQENQETTPMEEVFPEWDDLAWTGGHAGMVASHPIDIENHPMTANHAYHHTAPSMVPLPVPAQEAPVLSAPAARGYLQNGNSAMFGSALSSPGDAPMGNFINQLPDQFAHPFDVPNNQTGLEMTQNVAGSAHSDSVFPETKEQLSPNSYVQSPYYGSSAEQPVFFASNVSAGKNTTVVFRSSSQTNLRFQNYTNSADCSNSTSSLLPETKPNICGVSYGQTASSMQYPHQPQQQLHCGSLESSYSSTPYSPSSFPHDEAGTSGRSRNRSFTEQTKADQRRIRNNEACRKSRRKRKYEKEQTEAKVSQLTNENVELKKQIKDLEGFVKIMKGNVQRRMSHS